MTEFTVFVNAKPYLCITSGEGSDFLVEQCFDEHGNEIECDPDIYEAAEQEHRERLIAAAEYMADR